MRIHPAQWESRWESGWESLYERWSGAAPDWCVSRQLWWGHRIPIWHGPGGEMTCVGPDEQPPGAGWTQDPDVLDAWFSCGLWPFVALGWPDDTADLRRFYPADVLVTAYDSVFLWVTRAVLLGVYALKDRGTADSLPFRTISLHGLVRDEHGRGMSKSKGNGIDPLVWMDAYGADAVRFALAREARPGRDLTIGQQHVRLSRGYCDKIWNAGRFALINGVTVPAEPPARERLTGPDRWILSRLTAVTAEANAFMEEYQHSKACATLYRFAREETFNWYLELAKVSLGRGGAEAALTREVLGHVLGTTLRLLHPYIPYLTETLWLALHGVFPGPDADADADTDSDSDSGAEADVLHAAQGHSIMLSHWPVADESLCDPEAEAQIAALRRTVAEVRRCIAAQGRKAGQKVAARLDLSGPLAAYESELRALARLADPDTGFAPAATVQTRWATVHLDFSGSFDLSAERDRLARDLAAAQRAVGAAETKLAGHGFVSNAPAGVVSAVRARSADAQARLTRIAALLGGLPPA